MSILTSVAISGIIITGSWDATIKLWDPRQSKSVGTYSQHDRVNYVHFIAQFSRPKSLGQFWLKWIYNSPQPFQASYCPNLFILFIFMKFRYLLQWFWRDFFVTNSFMFQIGSNFHLNSRCFCITFANWICSEYEYFCSITSNNFLSGIHDGFLRG